ncbi:hypothetical protein Poly51_17030 [Rubripirellula tenax]|uniref:VWFA domain-containing protein n=1 Tax=Rubripirellula tenax TaxID=2528015 RepID=A0A5C6FAU1_9BACT|nr:vWA domain-containing protein [Rubripirellula tenax]TWU58923.1 hypothetical protein Poly51_17030 [Rubripirellula tenax]
MADPLRLIETPPPQQRGLLAVLLSIALHLIVAMVLLMIIRTTVIRKTMQIKLTLANERGNETTEELRSVVVIEPTEASTPMEPIPEIPVAAEMPKGDLVLSSALKATLETANTDASPSIDFFGSRASGDHFVFILDNSLSMSARNNGRYLRACEELLRSVSRLTPHQRYSVFLFCWETAPIFHERQPRYQSAMGDHLDELRQWITRASLGPGTDPRRALALASHMNPDAVFLLTDGDFNQPDRNRNDSGWIDADGNPYSTSYEAACRHLFAERGIPVHTIAYENPFSRGQLREIAEQTGGTFRYVPTRDMEPIDFERFHREVQAIDALKKQDIMRMRKAKAMLRDGELVFAEYLIRGVDAQRLSRQKDQVTLAEIQRILAAELGDVRLEDFPVTR